MPSSARRYRPLLLRAGLAIMGGCLQHGLEPAQDQQVEGIEPIKEPFGEAALGIDVERPDNGAGDWSDLVYTAYGTFQAYEGVRPKARAATTAWAARSEAERAEREAAQMRPCTPTRSAPSATGRQSQKSQKTQACPKARPNRRLHRYADPRRARRATAPERA